MSKCEACGKEIKTGRPLCYDCWKLKQSTDLQPATKSSENHIHVPVDETRMWANRLYAICKMGLEYPSTDYDRDRYLRAQEISQSLYAIANAAKKTKSETCSLSERQMWFFSKTLEDVGRQGLDYAQNRYDEQRYLEIDNLAQILQQRILQSKRNTSRPLPQSEDASPQRALILRFVTDDEIPRELSRLINQAKDTIFICSPWVTLTALANELSALRKQKIDIRLLTRRADPDSPHAKQLATWLLDGFQIAVQDQLHAKLLIVDNTLLYLGSANLTSTMAINLEAGLITDNPSVVQPAVKYFNRHFFDAGNKMVTRQTL